MKENPRKEKNLIDQHRDVAARLNGLLSTQRSKGRTRD
jgi:hypothetical protein